MSLVEKKGLTTKNSGRDQLQVQINVFVLVTDNHGHHEKM